MQYLEYKWVLDMQYITDFLLHLDILGTYILKLLKNIQKLQKIIILYIPVLQSKQINYDTV